jgi:hypothetical protein
MSEKEASNTNKLATFLGSLGAILIFVLILAIAYLPNRPPPVDEAIAEQRRNQADEAIAAGRNKITGYEVINAEKRIARIPIQEAKEITLKAYQDPAASEQNELEESNESN